MHALRTVNSSSPPLWLRALGREELPERFELNGRIFLHDRTFKHDFFAATALYRAETGERAVLKIGRKASLFGFPLDWIGLFLTRREARMLTAMQGLSGVPQLLGMWQRHGLVRSFVDGGPLAKDAQLNDDFFPRLSQLIDAIHARNTAYVDLEKRENVLLGDDGRPYLIDFQISWRPRHGKAGPAWPARDVLLTLQNADRDHLLKHWRRLRPDQAPEETTISPGELPWYIRLHRLIFRPIIRLRRQLLVWLGARDTPYGRSPG